MNARPLVTIWFTATVGTLVTVIGIIAFGDAEAPGKPIPVSPSATASPWRGQQP